jgi:hypothetical protein
MQKIAPKQTNQESELKKITLIIIGLFLLNVVAKIYYSNPGKREVLGFPKNFIVETTPSSEPGVVCSMDAQVCPDGSSVGRTGPNCEFTECPVLKEIFRFTIPSEYNLKAGELRQVDLPSSIRKAEVRINGSKFFISVHGHSDGYCPFGEKENYWCKERMEEFPSSNGFFIWEDSVRGAFALNTLDLIVSDHKLEIVSITKESDQSFTEQEVKMWKQILRTLEYVE